MGSGNGVGSGVATAVTTELWFSCTREACGMNVNAATC